MTCWTRSPRSFIILALVRQWNRFIDYHTSYIHATSLAIDLPLHGVTEGKRKSLSSGQSVNVRRGVQVLFCDYDVPSDARTKNLFEALLGCLSVSVHLGVTRFDEQTRQLFIHVEEQ